MCHNTRKRKKGNSPHQKPPPTPVEKNTLTSGSFKPNAIEFFHSFFAFLLPFVFGTRTR